MQKRKRIMFRVLRTDLGGDKKKKLFFVILEFPAKIPRDRYSKKASSFMLLKPLGGRSLSKQAKT
jgi:hypothetical protein